MTHSLNLKNLSRNLKIKGCKQPGVYFKLRDIFAGAYTRMTPSEYKLTIKAIQEESKKAIDYVKKMQAEQVKAEKEIK